VSTYEEYRTQCYKIGLSWMFRRRQLLLLNEAVAFLGLFDPTLREGNTKNGNSKKHTPRFVGRGMAIGELVADRGL
jgi:hypothetical protein